MAIGDAYATTSFNNVSVPEWMETVLYLREKFGTRALAERARQIVSDALAAVEKVAEQSRLAHAIGGPLVTDKTIKKFERENMMNWQWSKHLYVDVPIRTSAAFRTARSNSSPTSRTMIP